MKNDDQIAINREMYKKIKGMNREQIQNFATTIYLEGVKSVETVGTDLDLGEPPPPAHAEVGASMWNSPHLFFTVQHQLSDEI